jgi:hypothetical protein
MFQFAALGVSLDRTIAVKLYDLINNFIIA